MAYEYINSTGVIIPDTADLLGETQQSFKSVFSQDLVVTPDTPQGILITALTIVKDLVVRNNAALANQINPLIAGGIFLDAILALTGYQRFSQTFSSVLVNMAGVPGAVIPAGITGQTSLGDIFASQSSITLDSSGLASVNFSAVSPGPIGCPVGSLNTIVSGAIGLETITNPSDAVLGSTTESDDNAKIRRKVSLALQGTSLTEAILSAVNKTIGVNSSILRENRTDVTQVIDGVTMIGHSIYMCVDGGFDSDVALSMTETKGGGCSYNNGPGIPESVPITNEYSGQVIDVLFDRPIFVQILVRATVGINQAIEDPVTAVRKAIVDYSNNMVPGTTGLVVGASVSCFELAGAVNREAPELFVQNMEISLISPISYSNNTIPISVWQKAVIQQSSITVIII